MHTRVEVAVADMNTAFAAATGWQREEVVGRGETELGLWGGSEARAALEGRLRESGRLRGVDVQLCAKDGSIGDYLMSADTVEINGTR